MRLKSRYWMIRMLYACLMYIHWSAKRKAAFVHRFDVFVIENLFGKLENRIFHFILIIWFETFAQFRILKAANCVTVVTAHQNLSGFCYFIYLRPSEKSSSIPFLLIVKFSFLFFHFRWVSWFWILNFEHNEIFFRTG